MTKLNTSNLQEALIKEFNLVEGEVSHYCTDLQICPEKVTVNDITHYLRQNYEHFNNVEVQVSDIQGQEWYGKRFIEIPFACTNDKLFDKGSKR